MKALIALGVWLVCATLLVVQPLPVLRYTLGTAYEGPLPYGFWPAETNAAESYRWSDGSSWLRLFGYATAESVGVSLRLIGPQGSRGEATLLQIQTPAEVLLSTTAPASWRTYHLIVPHPGPGWRTPELELTGTVAAGVPGDQRQVGVAVSNVTVRPLGGLQSRAALEYAVFLSLTLGLVWVLGKAFAGVRVAWLLAFSLLVALFGWRYAAPDHMAYWLPPLWGLLLLPAGSVGLLWLAHRLSPSYAAQPIVGGVGLLLGLSGGFGLRYNLWPLLSGLLLLGGGLLAAVAVAPLAPSVPAVDRIQPRRTWYLFALLASFALALGLRLVDLSHLPLGMWRDEARHGLIALRILNDPAYRPVYDAAADLPALIFYLQSASIVLFEPTVFAVRVVPALAGALTVFVLAGMATQWWGRTAGLVAAMLLATSFWHLWLSRIAFAAVIDPLFTLLALFLLWRICANLGSPRQQLGAGLGAGIALGLALYTYHPARLMPLVALLWVGLHLGLQWSAWQRAWRPLLAFGVSLILVASPLVWYFISQTAAFNQRVNQVSLLDREAKPWALTTDLDYNVIRYAMMWHVEGDQAARHNLPGQPMLDPVTGFLFLLGLFLLIMQRPPALWRPLLAFLGVALLPGLLSNDAPHAVRTVDAIAPALLIATYGAMALLPMLGRWSPMLFRSSIVLGIGLLVSVNAGSYLGQVRYDQRVWDAFHYQAETTIGQTIQAGWCPGPAFVPSQYADSEVIQYLAFGHGVYPYHSATLQSPLPPGACVFVATDTPPAQWEDLEQIVAGVAQPQIVRPFPGTAHPMVWWYRIPELQQAAE
ncbi:MAG: ArnT family glycosyltransferase [Oscillochloridaceae bacterium umkhey_bin13]